MANPYFPAEITPWPSLAVMLQGFHAAWKKHKGSSPKLAALHILLAHCGLETGWGKEMYCHNLGNVKAHTGWSGGVTYYQGNEILKGKAVWFDFTPGKLNRFRAFPTLQEGIDNYMALKLKSKRYSKCIGIAEQGSVIAYARCLHKNGYFTAPPEKYAKTLESCMSRVKGLPMPSAAPAPGQTLAPSGTDPLQSGAAPKPFNPWPPKGKYRPRAAYAKKMGWNGAEDKRPLAPMPKASGGGAAPASGGGAPSAGAPAPGAPSSGAPSSGAPSPGGAPSSGAPAAPQAGTVKHCPKCGGPVTPVAAPAGGGGGGGGGAPSGPAVPSQKVQFDAGPAANKVSAKFQLMLDYLKFSFDGRGCVYGPMNLKYDKEKNLCIANNRWSKKQQPKRAMDPLTQGFACSTLCSWISCYWLNIDDQWANWIGNNTAKCLNEKYKGKSKHYNAEFAHYFTPIEGGARKPWSYWLAEDRWKQFQEFNIGLQYGHVITVWKLGERLKIKNRAGGNQIYEPGLYKLSADGSFNKDRTIFSATPLCWKRIDTDKRYVNKQSTQKGDVGIWMCKDLTDEAQPNGGAYASNPVPQLRFGKLEQLPGVPSLADAQGKLLPGKGGGGTPKSGAPSGGSAPAAAANQSPPPPGPGMPAPKPGLTGSAFVKKHWDTGFAQREKPIEDALLAGHFPPFLKQWKAVQLSGGGHTGTIWVTPDFLSIGTDADFVRMPMAAMTAQRIADAWNCVLPTMKMVDAIYNSAEHRIVAPNLKPGPKMSSTEWLKNHHDLCEKGRKGKPLGMLMAGHKKNVVLAQDLLSPKQWHGRPAPKKRVAIYGWWLWGKCIQSSTSPHALVFVDYAQGIRLVKNVMKVDGQDKKVVDVMRDPKLCTLVSKTGKPITVIRYPAC